MLPKNQQIVHTSKRSSATTRAYLRVRPTTTTHKAFTMCDATPTVWVFPELSKWYSMVLKLNFRWKRHIILHRISMVFPRAFPWSTAVEAHEKSRGVYCGTSWYFIASGDSMEVSWVSMECHGLPWTCKPVRGYPWKSMLLHGISMGLHHGSSMDDKVYIICQILSVHFCLVSSCKIVLYYIVIPWCWFGAGTRNYPNQWKHGSPRHLA